MSKAIRRWALLVGVAGLVLAADQGAKWWVMRHLALGESWVPIKTLGDYVRVTRSLNTGAAFGIFPLASEVFLVLALVTVGAFVITYPKLPAHATLTRIGIALVSGGALSNAVDRLRFDHVIDYVHVQLSPNLANISNFADHAITLGVVLMLLDQWLAERHEKDVDDETAVSAAGEPPGDPTGGHPPPIPPRRDEHPKMKSPEMGIHSGRGE
jgi:signal peptidase II